MQILSYLYSARQDDRAGAAAGGGGEGVGGRAGEEAGGGGNDVGNGLTVRPFQNAKR